MSLPFGLLGLLSYQENTGYELKKMFDDSLGHFWHAESSQIYRELSRMEKSGWVSSRIVVQYGKPNKRIYTITEEGRTQLAQWLALADSAVEKPHEGLLMRIFFGADNPRATLRLLEDLKAQCTRMLQEDRVLINRIIEAYVSQLKQGSQHKMYWEMPLELAVAEVQAKLIWADRCIEKIREDIQNEDSDSK